MKYCNWNKLFKKRWYNIKLLTIVIDYVKNDIFKVYCSFAAINNNDLSDWWTLGSVVLHQEL